MDETEKRLLTEANELQRRSLEFAQKRHDDHLRMISHALGYAFFLCALVALVYGLAQLDLPWGQGLFWASMPAAVVSYAAAFGYHLAGKPGRAALGALGIILSILVAGLHAFEASCNHERLHEPPDGHVSAAAQSLCALQDPHLCPDQLRSKAFDFFLRALGGLDQLFDWPPHMLRTLYLRVPPWERPILREILAHAGVELPDEEDGLA